MEEDFEVDEASQTVQVDETDKAKLSLVFRVKKTQIRMMEDRGYNIDEDDLEIKKIPTADLFMEYIEKKVPKLATETTAFWDFLSKTYSRSNGEAGENIVIFLPPPSAKSFPTTRLAKYIDVVKRTPSIKYIDIIFEFPLPNTTKEKLAITNRNIASWIYSDLVFPIPDSYYVGNQFRILTDEEFKELYKDSGVFKGHLARMRRNDPIVKYWQWLPGMVIESREIGDLLVAVTHTIKHYVVTSDSIDEVVEVIDIPGK